jgi:opacity protein-like surface antigen
MKSTQKGIALALLATLSFAALADDEQVLNSAPIDVDGYLHQEQNVTDGELERIKSDLSQAKNLTKLAGEKSKNITKLNGQTENLIEAEEEYVDKAAENKVIMKDLNAKRAEQKKKLDCVMAENPGPECAKYVRNRNSDTVSTAQAATAPVVAAQAPEVVADPSNPFEVIKLTPYAGVTNYSGKIERLESQFAGGLNLETNVSSRISMGVGFNYAQFSTQDFANNFGAFNYSGYQNMYGQAGREIQYKSMGLNMFGKFFITQGQRFRPYVGAGLGYNRATLKYAQNNQFNNGTSQFGNEEANISYATGTLMGGSEIMITKSVGLALEMNYTTGIGSGSSNNNAGSNLFSTPDQNRLNELGQEVINSHQMSLFAGMLIVF